MMLQLIRSGLQKVLDAKDFVFTVNSEYAHSRFQMIHKQICAGLTFNNITHSHQQMNFVIPSLAVLILCGLFDEGNTDLLSSLSLMHYIIGLDFLMQ